jgi:hypothetical protein
MDSAGLVDIARLRKQCLSQPVFLARASINALQYKTQLPFPSLLGSLCAEVRGSLCGIFGKSPRERSCACWVIVVYSWQLKRHCPCSKRKRIRETS